MTGEDRPTDESFVADLLAAAHTPHPALPPDVAARLEQRLAALHEEPRQDPHEEPHEDPREDLPGQDELARRRRRRTRTGLLVAAAAAAVVAGGVVVPTVLEQGDRSESSRAGGATADQTVNQPGGGSEGFAPPSDARTGAVAPPSAPTYLLDVPTDQLPRVRAEAGTARDAQRLFDQGADVGAGTSAPSTVRITGCSLPDLARDDRLVAVRVSGDRASLVFRGAESADPGQRVRVELYACDDPQRPLAVTAVRE